VILDGSGEPSLPERAVELRALDDAIVATADGRGRFVIIEGEAGIGKSSLVRHALTRSVQNGLRPLRATGSELERNYPYGVALALFGPLVREMERTGSPGGLFAGPAALAASLFGSLTEPEARAGDPFATVHGLYWLTLNAADHGPLALILEDAQWSDEASLRFLHYLGQRVADLPVAVVAAFRTGDVVADDVTANALRNMPAAVHLRPAPLSVDAVGQLLRSLDPTADASTIHAVFEATRGNPFFVAEVGRDRRASHAREPASPMPVPESVARSVKERIARLDSTAQHLGEAIAVLGEEADLRRAARLCGMSDEEALRIARELTDAGIIEAVGALGFAHPLVRAAVYSGIPSVARGRLHRDAGLLLATDSAPLGVIGGQLLEAERSGDARVIDLLRRAADEAVLRGEPRVAVRLLARALEEPPTGSERVVLLIALARAEALIASPAAIERFRMVLDSVTGRKQRAELLLELGHALMATAQWEAACETFEQGIGELRPTGHDLEDTDRSLHDQLEAGFVSSAWVSMDRAGEAEAIVDRILTAERPGAVHRGLAIWAAFHRNATVSASADDVCAIVRRALSEVSLDELIAEGQTVEVAAGALLATDELQTEIDLLSGAIEAAGRARAYGKVGIYSYCRAWPFLFSGRLTDAVADAQAAIRAADAGWETYVPAARAALALALLELDDLDAAAEALTFDGERWAGRVDFELLIPLARGRLAFARGDLSAALELFGESGQAATRMGMRTNAPADWRVWTVTTLARLGRRDEARALAAETIAIGRQWGALWPLACSLRAAAIADPGPDAIDLFREAIVLHEGSPAHLENARTLLEYGSALRHLGRLREARESLSQAMDLSHRLGARALLERCRLELHAAGSRPRRYAVSGVESLTPAELRVARLAAEGRTNREVAQALFVTPKAVEYHLANAYPKLGITSRRELRQTLESDAAALGRPRP
jgi:DNA-binding CsgD family transcriptional regulator